MSDPHEAEKSAAAAAAVGRVRPGMRLALGTGSTAAFAVRALAARFPAGDGITCVASSERTEALAQQLGVSVGPLQPDDRFDLMIDGADEVDPSLALTKGARGRALPGEVPRPPGDRAPRGRGPLEARPPPWDPGAASPWRSSRSPARP